MGSKGHVVGTCTWFISIHVVYFNPSCLFCFKKLVSVGTNRSNVKFTVVIWHSFSGLITILSQYSTAYLYLTLFFKMLNVEREWKFGFLDSAVDF